MRRYRRNRLIREQAECGRDETPTIIPFPSEEARAADRPGPQKRGEIQDDAGHASAEHRLWVSQARRKAAKKKPEKRWDWSRFIGLHEKSPEERLERAIARYRKEKRLSGNHPQLPAFAATIIPFPSEQAQAAGGSGDPPGDT